MTDQPGLWDVGPPDEGVQEILDRMAASQDGWMQGARTVLYVMAQERPVSADDLHKLIDAGDIPPLPDGVSSNVLGSLFRDDRFKPVGWKRSERDSAHGNIIRRWIAD